MMPAFDLVLSYPQWQGSARAANLPRGAAAAALVCADFGPLVTVPIGGAGETRHSIRDWTAIIEQFRAAQAILREHDPRRVLTAGGDCACDIAIIDYLQQRHPGLTVLWIDAHLDANSPQTSPSASFHGMPVRAILGSAPTEMQALLAAPVPACRFHYVAAHVGDAGEWAFQREQALDWWAPDAGFAGPVHIHFDLDALDPRAFPHVAYPEGRLSPEAGLEIVRRVAASGWLVGLTITEFAPADAAAADAGAAFIRQLCTAAVAG